MILVSVSSYFKILEIRSFNQLRFIYCFPSKRIGKLIVFDSYFLYGKLSIQLDVAKLSFLSRIRVNIEMSFTRKVAPLIETCNNLGQKKRVSLSGYMGSSRYSSLRCSKQSFFSFFSKKVVV